MPDPILESSLEQGVQITGENPVVIAYSLSVTGLSVKPVSEIVKVFSSGKHTAQAIFGGAVKFTGSFDFVLDETTKAATSLALPTAPTTPPPAKIYPLFSLNDGKYKYTGCKCTGLKTGITLNKEAKVTFSFTAKARVAGSAVTIPPLTDPFIGHNITLTGVADKDTESVDLDITNGVTEKHGMSGAARTPNGMAEGYQNIDLTMKFNEDHAADVAADALSVIATATIVLKKASGGVGDFTITLTKLLPGDDNRDATEGDIVKYGLVYGATTAAFA